MAVNWPAWAKVAESIRNYHMHHQDEVKMKPSDVESAYRGYDHMDGTYYCTKTLLWSCPDRNKRTVYRWPSDVPVLVMNDRMGVWTEDDERRLVIILKALNTEALK